MVALPASALWVRSSIMSAEEVLNQTFAGRKQPVKTWSYIPANIGLRALKRDKDDHVCLLPLNIVLRQKTEVVFFAQVVLVRISTGPGKDGVDGHLIVRFHRDVWADLSRLVQTLF